MKREIYFTALAIVSKKYPLQRAVDLACLPPYLECLA